MELIVRIPLLFIRWLFWRKAERPAIIEGQARLRGEYRLATTNEVQGYVNRLSRCLQRRNRAIKVTAWLSGTDLMVKVQVNSPRAEAYAEFLRSFVGGQPAKGAVIYKINGQVPLKPSSLLAMPA